MPPGIIAAMNLDPDSCYRALTTHDARFDGRFFVGVRTTRIASGTRRSLTVKTSLQSRPPADDRGQTRAAPAFHDNQMEPDRRRRLRD